MDAAPPALDLTPQPPSLEGKGESEPPRFSPAPRGEGRGRGSSADLLLDALKHAIAVPGEHRLFRSGKLAGLFPSRAGTSADAALRALTDSLLETVRTEARGKLVVEWVRATPRAVAFVADHDSPKAALRELRDVIGATRAGVPAWMADAREQAAALAAAFERQAAEMMKRLDVLTERVEAALRRAEAAHPRLPDAVATIVPWGVEALEYLDRRKTAGAVADCPLGELFSAIRGRHPGLTVPEFHAGLRRLHDTAAVRLTAAAGELADPEFALIVGAVPCSQITR